MAVEIVRKGRDPNEEPLGGACVHCGTVVRCLQKDVLRDYDLRDQRSYRYVSCPVCGQNVYVRENYDFGGE